MSSPLQKRLSPEWQIDPRPLNNAPMNSMRCRNIILGLGKKDVGDEALRITIKGREHTALDMQHQPVTGAYSVGNTGQIERDWKPKAIGPPKGLLAVAHSASIWLRSGSRVNNPNCVIVSWSTISHSEVFIPGKPPPASSANVVVTTIFSFA